MARRLLLVVLACAIAFVSFGYRFLSADLTDDDYLFAQRYVEVGTTGFGASTNASFRVLVDRQRTPTGTYAPLSLPCFTAPGR